MLYYMCYNMLQRLAIYYEDLLYIMKTCYMLWRLAQSYHIKQGGFQHQSRASHQLRNERYRMMLAGGSLDFSLPTSPAPPNSFHLMYFTPFSPRLKARRLRSAAQPPHETAWEVGGCICSSYTEHIHRAYLIGRAYLYAADPGASNK